MGVSRTRESIELRKAERELFFWTVHQVLWSILLAAFVLYTIVSLLSGDLPRLGQVLRIVHPA